jgi:hypothetical protein
LPAAGLGCAGFALIRKAIGDRLVVTGDGLIVSIQPIHAW